MPIIDPEDQKPINSIIDPIDNKAIVPAASRSMAQKILGVGGERFQFLPERVARGIGGVLSNIPSAVLQSIRDIPQIPKKAITAAQNPDFDIATEQMIGPAAETAMLVSGLGPGTVATKATKEAIKRYETRPRISAAEKMVQRALERDESSLSPIPKLRERISTLADIGGENVQGLLERIAQTPGAARTDLAKNFVGRQQGQLFRLSSDLRSLLGVKSTAVKSIDEQIALRSKNASPLYAKAFEEGDGIIWSPELERLTGAPEIQQAMHSAIGGWQRSQIASGYGTMNPGATIEKLAEAAGVEVSKNPTLKMLHGKVPVQPNLQFWDYTKNALDDIISGEVRPDGTVTKRGRDLIIIGRKLKSELDKAVPSYKQAREAWAGPSSYINSIKEGQSIASIPAEELQANFAKMTPSEQEGFRIGAVMSLTAKMGSKSAKLADITNVLRSPEMKSKISMIMPNAQSAAVWDRVLDFEMRSSGMVGRALKGSPTARRLLEAEDTKTLGGDLVVDALKMAHPKTALLNYIPKVAETAKNRYFAKRDEQIINMLMQKPSGNTLTYLREKGLL